MLQQYMQKRHGTGSTRSLGYVGYVLGREDVEALGIQLGCLELQLGCLELPIATMLPPFLRAFLNSSFKDGKISRLHIIIVVVVEVVVVVVVVVMVVAVFFFVVVAVLKVPSRALYEMKQRSLEGLVYCLSFVNCLIPRPKSWKC